MSVTKYIIDTIAFLVFLLVMRFFRKHLGRPLELHTKRYIKKRKIEAETAFRSQRASSTDPRYQFDGKTAQVLSESEEIQTAKGCPTGYMQTRVARSESGEYFWFLFLAGQPPVLKHIEHGSAKALLREKYVPPRSDNAAHSRQPANSHL